MSRNYNELLKAAYEIEGLLALQAQRGNNAIATVDEMIADKIAMLSREFEAESDTDDAEAQVETIVETAVSEPVIAPEPAIEPIAKEPETTPSADEAIAKAAVEEERADADVRPAPDMSITLDEKLARERAQDIFKAFTLNDKFRFRRELFRGSQAEFDDALNIISQMSTIEEAEEYIYDDLCWNRDNEDVKAFMDIVTKHF